MIIECINCSKKFNVNSDLIPSEGRSIQCGSCNHLWFFYPSQQKPVMDITSQNKEDSPISSSKNNVKTNDVFKSKNIIKKTLNEQTKSKFGSQNFEVVKYQSKINFSFTRLLSYISVVIISFIGLIILIDTFKSPLFKIFPELEYILFSLFETLKDITLFIKDLI